MTHIFRHPKYYKEMRAKRRKLQAASSRSDKAYQINYDDFCRGDEEEPSDKQQAPSVKLQADKKNPE
jgi:hypothetical protein